VIVISAAALTTWTPVSRTPASRTPASARIHLLDDIRGLCVLLMVGFHLLYTLSQVFGVVWATNWLLFFLPAEPFFAGVFIFLCGISCRLSHSNLRRGLLLALVAVGLSAVLWVSQMVTPLMQGEMIWFGILHFLSVAILLFVPLRRALDRVPVLLGLLLCAALLLLTWHINPDRGSFVGWPGLFQ